MNVILINYKLYFRPECTESCKVRRRELESEAKALRKELRIKDEQYVTAQKEVNVSIKILIEY